MLFKSKQLLCICTLGLFIFLALASNKIHYGAFRYDNQVEDRSEKKNYIEKEDGSRIYGEKITWKSGLLAKDQIQIDKEKFKISDIRGYRQGQTYYGRLGNEYIKRIVRGKINVYVKFSEVTSTTNENGRLKTSTYTRTDHYAQKGDGGTMTVFGGQNAIKKMVGDCPVALEMADLSNGKMRKRIKKNKNYLNEIFETYNNDCKAVR
jgi:hypothetical protein